MSAQVKLELLILGLPAYLKHTAALDNGRLVLWKNGHV